MLGAVTRLETRVRAPNSVVLLGDAVTADVPRTLAGGLVAATESCIAVGTRSEADGETHVIVAERLDATDPPLDEAFCGTLSTPNRRLHVFNVHGVSYLEVTLGSEINNLRVLVDDRVEPAWIVILLER
jgi:hypothetical protein